MTTRTAKQAGFAKSAHQAAAALAAVDLGPRCERLGLAPPGDDGALRVDMLGRHLMLTPPNYEGTVESSSQTIHPADRILLLHYLQCDVPIEPTGQWITFRQFPGGQFYWGPFQNRSARPLTRQIRNDLDLLRRRLGRFDWRQESVGDLAARIRVFGRVEVMLVYRQGDDEFPPSADILFDASLPRVFGAEDVAALAARVCMRLCAQPCEPCSGCGLCDASLRKIQ